MKGYSIEEITADNHRPGMPQKGFLVRNRPHASHGWLGCRPHPTLAAAEEFAASLTTAGELPGQ